MVSTFPCRTLPYLTLLPSRQVLLQVPILFLPYLLHLSVLLALFPHDWNCVSILGCDVHHVHARFPFQASSGTYTLASSCCQQSHRLFWYSNLEQSRRDGMLFMVSGLYGMIPSCTVVVDTVLRLAGPGHFWLSFSRVGNPHDQTRYDSTIWINL